MTKKSGKTKAARTRSTTRDLQPKKAVTVKGGYTPSFRGGVFVAAGDVNNDGKAEIITS